MTPKMQTRLELVGYASAVVGLACLGWVVAGVVLAVAFGLLSLAAVLIFLGNV